jgi:hypothetical protein
MGGLLPPKFDQKAKIEFCTSVDTKPFPLPIANTMLAVHCFYSLAGS